MEEIMTVQIHAILSKERNPAATLWHRNFARD